VLRGSWRSTTRSSTTSRRGAAHALPHARATPAGGVRRPGDAVPRAPHVPLGDPGPRPLVA
jgi:hypothetical protein